MWPDPAVMLVAGLARTMSGRRRRMATVAFYGQRLSRNVANGSILQ